MREGRETMTSRSTLPLPLQVVLWGLFNSAAGAATGLAVGSFREGGVELRDVGVSVLFGNVVGFTVLLASTILFPRLRAVVPAARAAILILTLMSGSAAGTALVLYLFPLFVLSDLVRMAGLLAINAVLALIVGTVVYVYEDLRARLAETLREVEEVRLVESQLKEQAMRAELAALQARINPHFFFNTLNTISSLLEEDPERADEVLHTLAGLFRYTFQASDARPVPLSEELRFVDGYLAIERARFGERLGVVREVEPEALRIPVPGLILQPLVENAVAHGIAPLPEGGTVRISAKIRSGELVIEVGDDGAGIHRPSDELIREGHGLGNVALRLETLFRRPGLVELTAGPGGRGAIVRLRLPLTDGAAA